MKKLLFLFAIVLSTITFAQNSLTGKILGKDNLPISDVQVLLINASNEETLKVAITDKDGKFEIENVKFDEAKIVVEQSDYEKYTSD